MIDRQFQGERSAHLDVFDARLTPARTGSGLTWLGAGFSFGRATTHPFIG